MSIDPNTYIVSLTLKDQDGITIGTTQTIDLPLESVVVGGSYDKTNKKIVLILESGGTVDVPVGDLVAGLQTEITTTNKLSADLIADGTTNKVVTATEKSTWNNKQDAISDLATIRSNASAGKTASDTIATYGDIVTHNATEFAETVHTHAIADVTNLQSTLNAKALKTDLANYIPKSFGSAYIPGNSTAPTSLVGYGAAGANGYLTSINIMQLGVNKFFRCYERGATITCNYDNVVANLGKNFCNGSVSGYYSTINPSTAFASKPFVWEVTSDKNFEVSDVSTLQIFGHRLSEKVNCTAYKIEVYAYNDSLKEKEWITIIDYSGSAVNIAQAGYGMYKPGHTVSNPYYNIHGVRLTISGCTDTIFKIAEIVFLTNRGTEQPYQALHCVPDFGGTITGNLTVTGSINGTASKATADASGNTITTTYATKTELRTKQDKLTAGAGIKIEDNVISTKGTKILTDNATIIQDETGTVTAIGTKTKSNTNLYDWVGTEEEYNTGVSSGVITGDTQCIITDDEQELIGTVELNVPTKVSDLANDSNFVNKIQLDTKQDKLTAGTGIKIENNTISITTVGTSGWGDITGNIEDQGDLQIALDNKQDNIVSITKAEYDQLEPDPNTYYAISDDTSDVSILEIIYPVGSLYLSTNETCPLSNFFGTWELVISNYNIQDTNVNIFRRNT